MERGFDAPDEVTFEYMRVGNVRQMFLNGLRLLNIGIIDE